MMEITGGDSIYNQGIPSGLIDRYNLKDLEPACLEHELEDGKHYDFIRSRWQVALHLPRRKITCRLLAVRYMTESSSDMRRIEKMIYHLVLRGTAKVILDEIWTPEYIDYGDCMAVMQEEDNVYLLPTGHEILFSSYISEPYLVTINGERKKINAITYTLAFSIHNSLFKLDKKKQITRLIGGKFLLEEIITRSE